MRFFKRLGYYLYSVLEMLVGFKNWPVLWPVFLQEQPPKLREVQLRQPPVRIKVRGRMDIWSIKETFLDGFYTRYGIEIEDGWTILDVGAGIGDFSILAAHGRPNTLVYAFEPYLESYKLLIQNLTINALDNVLAFQRALWGESGTLALDLSGGEPLQIVSQGIDQKSEIAGMETVQALSLPDFWEVHTIDRVDLMKMDVEGAEYDILLQTPSESLTRIDRIIMEYHDVGEGRNHQVLASFLEKEGYRVERVENLVHQDLGYLYGARLSSDRLGSSKSARP